MKQALLLCFSDRGEETAGKLERFLREEYETRVIRPGHGQLSQVTKDGFENAQILIYISSCGIAARAIAPYIVHKAQDPAVLVCDELGMHIIALLSGHIGGANELTRMLAEKIGADPVITTATDINKKFSADAWAAKYGLHIDPLSAVKRFSSEILKRDLPMHCDFPVKGALPGGTFADDHGDLGVCISTGTRRPFEETLLLVPKIVHVGIGCKRNAPIGDIRDAVTDALNRLCLHPASVADLSSIDVKANEAGILCLAKEMNVPFRTYSASELNALNGSFTVSEFVRGTVGVDCVCERAAMLSAGAGGRLLLKKTKYTGVTCAVSIEDWRACFE